VRYFNYVFQGNLGLNQVPVGAKAVGALLVIVLAKGGKHDNLDVFHAGGVAQNVEHLKAADLRHHNIGYYEVGTFGLSDHQGLFAVFGGYDVVALCLQARLIDLTQVIVIFDEH
jgi:hypothetical protein